MTDQARIRALETTDNVIRELTNTNGMGVSELAEELDKPLSTIHNHLNTLESLNYVTKKGTKYKISSRFLEIGTRSRSKHPLYSASINPLEEIFTEFGETTGLLIEEDGYSVIYNMLFTEDMKTAINAGRRVPIHANAGGKAMLAEMSRDRVQEIIDTRGLPQMTENTICTPNALFKELEETIERGYAIENKESAQGVRGVAVSIGNSETGIGAIMVYGPGSRLDSQDLEESIPKRLMEAKESINLNLRMSGAI